MRWPPLLSAIDRELVGWQEWQLLVDLEGQWPVLLDIPVYI